VPQSHTDTDTGLSLSLKCEVVEKDRKKVGR